MTMLNDTELLELEQLLREEQKDNAKDDYVDYVEYVHNGLYQHAKHTKWLCEKIQNAIEQKKRMRHGEIPTENQYIILSVPPRHSKSMTITETLPSYYLGQFPNDRVIEGSYSTTFAQKFGKKNKQKLELYGEELFDVSISRESSSATDWDLKDSNGGMISRGILAGVTGEGADLMIIDDPIKNREEADSEVYRDKLWNEWVDSFSTRLHPGAIVIVIMTRWHEDDLVGRLQNEEYGEVLPWQVINLPLEAEEDDILDREVGEPLWPERYGYDFIAQRKKYKSSFNSLFQGRPTSQEGNVIKRAWWKYYDVIPQLAMKIMSVDATFKDGEDNDFVAIQVWGKSGANAYLIDQVKARMDFPTTVQAIENMKAKHTDIRGIFIEDKANGPAIISMLNNKIPGVIPVKPDGGKVARVNAITPYIEARNVHLPRTDWVHDFVEECASFPNSKHDDQVDAMSQALNRLYYYYGELPPPKEKPLPFPFRNDDEGEGGIMNW